MISKEKKIKIIKNGPYLVSGNIPLDKQIIGVGQDNEPDKYIIGEKYKTDESYALCRCGESSNKPFCDGTHIRIGFNGEETASNEKYHKQANKINGPTLDLLDAENYCSSSRFCHPKGGVWALTKNSNDFKSRVMAIKESFNCPSGRLTHIDKKSGKELEPVLKKSISLLEDPQALSSGPIWAKGKIPIESSDGELLEIRNRITLCRCGKSSNKPFCDGKHIKTKFNDGDESLK